MMALQRISGQVKFLTSPPHGRLMLRSALLWGLADIAAQAAIHYAAATNQSEDLISFENKRDKEFKINWWRVFIASSFGFGANVGPAGYLQFQRKQSMMYRGSQPSTAELFCFTVVPDGLCGAPRVASFPFMSSLQGRTRSVEQAKEVKKGFTPALVLGGAVLPAVHIANSRLVPVPYQLHCASLLGLLASCSFSWIQQRWEKQRAAAGVPEE